MKQILCFGDSNTFGTNPAGGRHERNIRWPGRLQTLLGPDYYVIEEGMGGRNIMWDDPLEPMRNGLAYLPVSLQSHQPLDLVIVSLGTNDCKNFFPATPRVIAAGLERLCDAIERFPYRAGAPIPKILIIAPIQIGADIEHSTFVPFDRSSYEKSLQLGGCFEAVAKRHGHLFLDASNVAAPSPLDQLHMDADGHAALAEAVAVQVRTAFQTEP